MRRERDVSLADALPCDQMEAADWSFAQHELLENQGIDMKMEMERKFKLNLCLTKKTKKIIIIKCYSLSTI